jgi:radical SAM superfamily enzyme YgiQ (UPF0313 family)
MPDIVLATLNAKYPHAAFGLRYLFANLGELSSRAAILEFDINQRATDILEVILAQRPQIVGLGVYIWNSAQSTLVAADLKRLLPEVTLILGGPEISYETQEQEIFRYADYVITGEADLAFAEVCKKILAGQPPAEKIITPELPQFAKEGEKGLEFRVQGSGKTEAEAIQSAISLSSLNPKPSTLTPPLLLPYHLYTDHDLAHRVVYVEASRGCPFKCEFCLSSLDVPVRNAPLSDFLAAMQSLLDRGLRQFKFVDRTFNLNLNFSKAILQFFLDRLVPGLFLHFEMIPDRLPEALRALIKQFPPGVLQFEVGIQTFNEHVSALISRRQDNNKLQDNLRFLRNETGVHIHTDLIVGLPGEDLASFARGFDRLVDLNPQEIQVGILKRLRGTPIVRHDQEWGMIYSPHPPYEILQTRLIDFATMQRLRRFSRYWDLLSNSGNFRQTLPLLWTSPEGGRLSPFAEFINLADGLYARMGRNHGIALQELAEVLFLHLTGAGHLAQNVARLIWLDYQRAGRSDRPGFLHPHIADQSTARPPQKAGKTPARQARHLS